jgi:uncharacterized membrane protein
MKLSLRTRVVWNKLIDELVELGLMVLVVSLMMYFYVKERFDDRRK